MLQIGSPRAKLVETWKLQFFKRLINLYWFMTFRSPDFENLQEPFKSWYPKISIAIWLMSFHQEMRYRLDRSRVRGQKNSLKFEFRPPVDSTFKWTSLSSSVCSDDLSSFCSNIADFINRILFSHSLFKAIGKQLIWAQISLINFLNWIMAAF